MGGIQINHVSFGYENCLVLQDISMDIQKGDFVGIVGSNGTGKSTLMKLILGILSPKEGSVVKECKTIGYVAQSEYAIKADFPATVLEMVMLNLYQEIGLFKRPKKKHFEMAKRALQTVGMLDKAEQQIGTLSGGQQQRVMIAKALVSSPDILILDEPTASIDVESEQMLYELLNRLNQESNLTIVMVTHSIESIEASMNKIFVIKNKQVSRRK